MNSKPIADGPPVASVRHIIKEGIVVLRYKDATFICEVCNLHTANRDKFAEHLASHIARRPFQCQSCKTPFSSKAECDDHAKNAHSTETELKIAILGCSKIKEIMVQTETLNIFKFKGFVRMRVEPPKPTSFNETSLVLSNENTTNHNTTVNINVTNNVNTEESVRSDIIEQTENKNTPSTSVSGSTETTLNNNTNSYSKDSLKTDIVRPKESVLSETSVRNVDETAEADTSKFQLACQNSGLKASDLNISSNDNLSSYSSSEAAEKNIEEPHSSCTYYQNVVEHTNVMTQMPVKCFGSENSSSIDNISSSSSSETAEKGIDVPQRKESEMVVNQSKVSTEDCEELVGSENTDTIAGKAVDKTETDISKSSSLRLSGFKIKQLSNILSAAALKAAKVKNTTESASANLDTHTSVETSNGELFNENYNRAEDKQLNDSEKIGNLVERKINISNAKKVDTNLIPIGQKTNSETVSLDSSALEEPSGIQSVARNKTVSNLSVPANISMRNVDDDSSPVSIAGSRGIRTISNPELASAERQIRNVMSETTHSVDAQNGLQMKTQRTVEVIEKQTFSYINPTNVPVSRINSVPVSGVVGGSLPVSNASSASNQVVGNRNSNLPQRFYDVTNARQTGSSIQHQQQHPNVFIPNIAGRPRLQHQLQQQQLAFMQQQQQQKQLQQQFQQQNQISQYIPGNVPMLIPNNATRSGYVENR